LNNNHHINRDYRLLEEDDGVVYRNLFIIDPNRILTHILRLAEAFQFVKNEVCHIGWALRSDTVAREVKEAKAYFHKH
uniref:thioredoxin-dependent peroxiredoxin n=1 Tax=Ascaris lumbricoides TaxID=6252 RepID=A0A0M3I3D7_ASCLU